MYKFRFGIFLMVLIGVPAAMLWMGIQNNDSKEIITAVVCFVIPIALLQPGIVRLYGGLFLRNYSSEQKAALIEIVDSHSEALTRKYLQYVKKDDYGQVNDSRWVKEVRYFVKNVVGDLPGDRQCLSEDEIASIVYSEIEHSAGQETQKTPEFDNSMDGYQYEYFCADLLNDNGWDAEVTQGSGDQGVDVVAKKGSVTVVVQCKKYSRPVGNKAVQEANAGKGFIGADKAIVVSNNSFTKSAITLAEKLGVGLFHHSDLTALDNRI